MKLTRVIGPHTVALDCAADLEPQAQALLETLTRLHAKGPALQDGSTVDFGWSRLTLRNEDGVLVVHEPDFHGDPRRQTLPFVDDTLSVARDQAELCQRFQVTPQDVRWDAVVAVSRSEQALETPRVYLERQPSENPRFTGWYLGVVPPRSEPTAAPAPPPKPAGDLAELAVYQVYARRPELLQVMALPTGWLAVFDDQIIEALLNPAGVNVWKPAS